MNRTVQTLGTIAASALVVGGIAGGVAVAQQTGQQEPTKPAGLVQPAADTQSTTPQQVEQGTTLKVKPRPKRVTADQTQDAATVDSASTTTTTSSSATTQEQTVTTSEPTSQPTQPASDPTTQAADPAPAAPAPPATEYPTPSPGPGNQGPITGGSGQAD